MSQHFLSTDEGTDHRMKREQHCTVCRGPLDLPDGYWTNCSSCERLADRYAKLSGESGDPDYAQHEIAHHIMLFRRLPRRRADWRTIEPTISAMPLGVCQLHELRVMALQYVTYGSLGWKPSLERLVDLSWPGLADADMARDRGKKIVQSRAATMRRVRSLACGVSSRSQKLYRRMLQKLRDPESA